MGGVRVKRNEREGEEEKGDGLGVKRSNKWPKHTYLGSGNMYICL